MYDQPAVLLCLLEVCIFLADLRMCVPKMVMPVEPVHVHWCLGPVSALEGVHGSCRHASLLIQIKFSAHRVMSKRMAKLRNVPHLFFMEVIGKHGQIEGP